ncbi:hypothetical protein [Ulvibacter antarcticus]|nr:hypothetical protein [Ulvibacter antarcticus]
MRSLKLFYISIFLISFSCGTDDIQNLGKSDCAVAFSKLLDQAEDDYIALMIQPDSDGNDQSLEACLNRKSYTQAYIVRLQNANDTLNTIAGCTDTEYFNFIGRILDRKQQLEEDMTSTWNRCEEIFGGG